MNRGAHHRRAVFTDLDGTLLGPDHQLSERNRETLKHLGDLGVQRIVVTGRSLYSCDRVLDEAFPIDLLVTSSGAGIFSYPPVQPLQHLGLGVVEIAQAITVLEDLQLDFMVHAPVPDNHHFCWRRFSQHNADFDRRLALYAGCHQLLQANETPQAGATQLLAIVSAADPAGLHDVLSQRLPGLNVLRTTSPLDHCSTWYEIFPASVCKSHAAAWICERLNLNAQTALAVGNDYNDLDLLRWAGVSCVVANAPAELSREFVVVAHHSEGGFSDAVSHWLTSFN